MALGAVVSVALLASCGKSDPNEGTNGVGRKSAKQIERQARSSAERAKAVHLSGKVRSGKRDYRLDMRLTDTGAVGEVSAQGGERFQLLRVDRDLYLKAGTAFWARQHKTGKRPTSADVAAARKLNGKYVKVPHKDRAYRQLRGFTDMEVMLDGVLDLNGSREKGTYGEVDDTRTVAVTADKGHGGIMEVSLEGTPHPLRVERGGDAGVVVLSDWNKRLTLRAPRKENVVDYGKSISAD
ncbi:hypothetical protein [Streptomyces sp. NPDC005438]|uniref:hypothetical protein n=1 Tax=Streptomyces sp. NPDC005438 TaxID=3156880 RepID=UPI0033B9FC3B